MVSEFNGTLGLYRASKVLLLIAVSVWYTLSYFNCSRWTNLHQVSAAVAGWWSASKLIGSGTVIGVFFCSSVSFSCLASLEVWTTRLINWTKLNNKLFKILQQCINNFGHMYILNSRHCLLFFFMNSIILAHRINLLESELFTDYTLILMSVCCAYSQNQN